MFDVMAFAPVASSSGTLNELQQLAEDLVAVQDVLAWWTSKASTYLVLSHMGLDYLSIPRTSFYYSFCFSY